MNEYEKEGYVALESSEIREGFIRQRRNLIVISLLLLFSQFSGGLLLKELNVFGNKTTLTNPIELETLLWFGFYYLLLRYYQYFHYSGPLGFQDAFFNKRSQFYQKIVTEKLPSYKAWVEEQLKSRDDEGNSPAKEFELQSSGSIRNFLWDVEIVIKARLLYEDNRYSLPERGFNINAGKLIIPSIRSFFYVIVKTPIVTHFIFPFVMASIPIIIKLFPSLLTH